MSEPRPTTAEETARWAHYRRAVERFVRSRVASADDTDDLVQEVLLRLHMHRGQLAHVNSPRAWIHRIARNVIADHYRRRRPGGALPDEIPEPGPNPAESALQAMAECLTPLVEQLPEPYRVAVRRADLEGWTQAELARAEGLSLSGAKSRVQRARAHLGSLLDARCALERDAKGRLQGCEPRTRCCEPISE